MVGYLTGWWVVESSWNNSQMVGEFFQETQWLKKFDSILDYHPKSSLAMILGKDLCRLRVVRLCSNLMWPVAPTQKKDSCSVWVSLFECLNYAH